MPSVILAGTTTGTALSLTSDTSGELQIQTNNGATTAMTLTTGGAAVFTAGTVSAPAITTTGDTNTGIFFPAADTIAFTEGGVESMRIDSSGNVGIGTSSPDNALTIQDAGAGVNKRFSIRNGDSTNNHKLIMGYNVGALSGFIPATSVFISGETNGGYGALTSLAIGTVSATPIILGTSNAERMRIDSAGNVGIGTSSPAYKLSVNGTGNFYNGVAGLGRVFFGDPGDPNGYIGIYRSSLGPANWNTVGNGLNFASFDGYTFSTGIAVFGSQTERMRIDSSGNTFIGGTTGFGRLVVNASTSDIYLGYNGATKQFAVDSAGQIYAQFTSITSLSDRRVKENIKPIQYGLDAVTKLNPVTFNFIAYPELQPTYGFIAQEVELILPELVDYEKDNKAEDGTFYKTLKMGDMLPILVKAIQEQQTLIENLTTRLNALEGK